MQPSIVLHYLIHEHFDHLRLQTVLSDLQYGACSVEKPILNHTVFPSIKEEVVESFEDIDVLLFEGIYTLCDGMTYDFLRYSTLRIFIDADDADISIWNWEREVRRGENARTQEKFEYDTKWDKENYRAVVYPTKKYADLVIQKPAKDAYELYWQ